MEKIPYLKLHKNICQEFWQEFGHSNKGTVTSSKSKEETLAALIRIGTIVLPTSRTRTPEFNRRQYTTYKSKLYGYNGFVLCFCCGAKARVRHHIIWIKNGGRNHKKNIVPLCLNCHAEIHPWLKSTS